MKERPILFSAPMVRAILDGSKTQTRRVVKPTAAADQVLRTITGSSGFVYSMDETPLVPFPEVRRIRWDCPYGQPGDRLWVRETWGVVSNDWDENGNLIDWVPDRPATAISEMPFGQGYYSGHAIYAADGAYEWAGDDDGGGEPRSAWHPSIHMPRAASRILLEIVSVRVERLHDLSEGDAIAEGIERMPCAVPDTKLWKNYNHGNGCTQSVAIPQNSFRSLWESINGEENWLSNPFVWVVEFKRVES